MGEEEFGDGPAFILDPDQIGDRHADIGKEDLIHFIPALDQLDRAHFNAGRLDIDQHEGNPLLALALGGGAHEAENLVGILAQRGPGFLAIDDVIIALADGAGLEAGEVGAGTGLGIALAPPIRAVENARQNVGFLLFGTEFDQDGAEHAQTEGHDARRVGQGAFLVEDMALHGIPARAAIFDRPGHGQPAAALQRRVPALKIGLAEFFAIANLGRQLFGQIVLEKTADFCAEGLFLWREVEIHGVLLDIDR